MKIGARFCPFWFNQGCIGELIKSADGIALSRQRHAEKMMDLGIVRLNGQCLSCRIRRIYTEIK